MKKKTNKKQWQISNLKQIYINKTKNTKKRMRIKLKINLKSLKHITIYICNLYMYYIYNIYICLDIQTPENYA